MVRCYTEVRVTKSIDSRVAKSEFSHTHTRDGTIIAKTCQENWLELLILEI